EIKSISKESGLTLEQFLNNQELYIPEKIKLDIDFNNGLFEIIPSVAIDNSIGFTNTFDRLPTVRDVYPISSNNGETIRVLLSEKHKKQLENIKTIRRVTDSKKINEISENPHLYFDEEIIDFEDSNTKSFLQYFSERVVEIGVYSPKFYPFASPYKSQWIPGIVIKDKVHGEKKIYFKTPQRLNEFIEKKENAIKNNKQTVEWENAEIPIEDAENFIKSAKKQFENPNKPIKQDKKTDHEVLIIKENAELTEFSNANKLPE